jgi:hypothetical protein
MRPRRFESTLLDLYKNTPQVKSVQTVEETGYDRHPYGLVVEYATGARVLMQITVTSRPGENFDEPEEIVEGGEPPAEVEVPELFNGAKLQMPAVDKHLVALVVNSGTRELASAEAYSMREKPGAIRYGANFAFHDGSVVRVFVVQAFPAGRDVQRGREFDVPAAV